MQNIMRTGLYDVASVSKIMLLVSMLCFTMTEITMVIASYIFTRFPDEAEDPACTPIFWISKWVDYSDKYGLGYQLNNGSVGVLFNDTTRMLMNEDGE